MKLSASILALGLLVPTSAFADDKDQSAAPATPFNGAYTTGWQLQGGSTASFLGGETGKGNAFSAIHANAELLAGGYVSDHFGMFGGIRLGFGTVTAGCDGCSSAALRLPVLFQYAVRDRLHGLYLDAGFSFLNLVTAKKGDLTQSVNDVADVELGIGYRIQHDRKSSLDVRLGTNVGRFTHASASIGDATADATISDPGIHYNFAAGVTYAFAP